MFNNLTKEIFCYSLIPFAIIAIMVFALIIIGKKRDNNYYKYDYFIKVLLFVIISLVLPLITGYTIWIYERFVSRGIVSSNLMYMVLLALLIIALVILLITAFIKLFKSINSKSEIANEE